MYSFSDSKGLYNIDITLAAKCNAGATCSVFPKTYQSTLEDKTVEYNYDPEEFSFFVSDCKIEPMETLGKHCIIYCNSPEGQIDGC